MKMRDIGDIAKIKKTIFCMDICKENCFVQDGYGIYLQTTKNRNVVRIRSPHIDISGNSYEFFRRVLTLEKTLIHHYTLDVH